MTHDTYFVSLELVTRNSFRDDKPIFFKKGVFVKVKINSEDVQDIVLKEITRLRASLSSGKSLEITSITKLT